LCGDIVETGLGKAGDENRALLALTDITQGFVLPIEQLFIDEHLPRLALGSLADRQGDTRRRLRHVLAEHEYRIGSFDFAQRRRAYRTALQDVAHQPYTREFIGRDAAVEIVGADQFAQRVVGFNAGAGRADTDDALRGAQTIRRRSQRGRYRDHIEAVALAGPGLARAVVTIHIAVAEAAAIAEEVMINLAVVAIFYAAKFTVALARAGVAPHRALLAHTGSKLHIPLAVVALGVGFIGEHAGRADLGQVAGKLAFEGAVFDAAEVDIIVRAEDAEVLATGVILVITHAAITGDTAVHLMVDERAEVLILVSALGEAIATLGMLRHHGHVLQMAVAALFTHRTIVRVICHQPFDDALAKCFRFGIVNGDVGVVGGGRHARHHQPAAFVIGVGVLLDGALAASTDTAQR